MLNVPDVSFDPSPLYSNQKIAAYSWGAGELVFGAEASQGKHFSKMLLAEKLGFHAASEKEVIETISFVHEYRHFQQDQRDPPQSWR